MQLVEESVPRQEAGKKKRPRNIYASEEQWAEINHAKEASNYTTLSDFMVGSALSQQLVIQGQIAYQLGNLFQICNDVLTSDSDGGIPGLARDDAQAAVERIIETCDAVITLLRKD